MNTSSKSESQSLDVSTAKVCAALQPFFSADLKKLLPIAQPIEKDFQYWASEDGGDPKPEDKIFDPAAYRASNIDELVKSQGFGAVAVSAGPWEAGAIIDGDDQFKIATKLKLPIRISAIPCADLTAAKLARWRMNISTSRKVSAYLVVKAFLEDADFQAYFDNLVQEGKRRMSEGGKAKKKKQAAVEIDGFNRRLEAAKFCMVTPWDFYYATKVLKDYAPEEKWGEFPDLLPDARKKLLALAAGDTSPKSAWNELKNSIEKAKKSNKLANIGEITSEDGIAASAWTGDMNTVYQGSCLEVLTSFPDEVVDRVVTSPFYHAVNFSYFKGWQPPETWEEYKVFMAAVLTHSWRIIRPGGMMIIQIDDTTENRKAARDDNRVPEFYDHRGLVMDTMRSLGVTNCQAKVWYKGETVGRKAQTASNSNPTNRVNHEHVLIFRKGIREDHLGAIMSNEERKEWEMSVWQIPPQPDSEKGDAKHHCKWSNELARRLACYGAHRGDVLLDPFCGTGNALEVAAGEGMQVLGIDMNSHSVERSQAAILRGIQEWKDRKATRIELPPEDPDFEDAA